jgi:phosphate-selective porin OprO and OprP
VQASDKGLSVASGDGRYSFALNGTVHSDGRFYLGDEPTNDTFLFRRVRPQLSGKLGELISFRITPEIAGNSTTLLDAWADVKLGANTQLRIGQMKSPVSLERLASASALPFIERTFASELAGNRDIGMQLQGGFAGGAITYAAGVFNGAVDGRNAATTNPEDEFELAGRLFFEPWRNGDSALKGLGFGIAGSVGQKEGTGNDFLPRYRSASQETVFRYLDTTAADGDHERLSPQGYFYAGPFGLLAEYITSEQELRNTTTGATDSLKHEAWQVTASWVLTGETASYRGVAPKGDFGWGSASAPGAWEFLVRLASLDIDDDAFPTFADATKAVENADTWALGVNWYLSRNLKTSLNYQFTEFEAGAAADDRSDEEVIFSRLQFAF